MLDGVVYGLEGAAGRAYGIHPRVRDGGPGTCNAWRGPHRTPGTFLVTLRSGASRYLRVRDCTRTRTPCGGGECRRPERQYGIGLTPVRITK